MSATWIPFVMVYTPAHSQCNVYNLMVHWSVREDIFSLPAIESLKFFAKFFCVQDFFLGCLLFWIKLKFYELRSTEIKRFDWLLITMVVSSNFYCVDIEKRLGLVLCNGRAAREVRRNLVSPSLAGEDYDNSPALSRINVSHYRQNKHPQAPLPLPNHQCYYRIQKILTAKYYGEARQLSRKRR